MVAVMETEPSPPHCAKAQSAGSPAAGNVRGGSGQSKRDVDVRRAAPAAPKIADNGDGRGGVGKSGSAAPEPTAAAPAAIDPLPAVERCSGGAASVQSDPARPARAGSVGIGDTTFAVHDLRRIGVAAKVAILPCEAAAIAPKLTGGRELVWGYSTG